MRFNVEPGAYVYVTRKGYKIEKVLVARVYPDGVMGNLYCKNRLIPWHEVWPDLRSAQTQRKKNLEEMIPKLKKRLETARKHMVEVTKDLETNE